MGEGNLCVSSDGAHKRGKRKNQAQEQVKRTMNPDKQQSTLEDILLELMVQNETLDKIQVNTLKALDLVPQRVDAVGSGEEGSSIEQICKSLLSIEAGIGFLVDTVQGGVDTLQSSLAEINFGIASVQAYTNTLSKNFRFAMNDIAFIAVALGEEFKLSKIRDLQQQERDKEMADLLEKLGKGSRGGTGADTVAGVEKPATFMEKLVGGLAILGGLISGFIAGVVGYFAKTFGNIIKAITKLLRIDQLLAKIGITEEFLANITKPFKNFFTKIKEIVEPIGEFFSSIVTKIKNLFSGEGALAKVGTLLEKLKPTALLETIKGFLGKFSKAFSFGKTLGVIFGKLLMVWDIFQSIRAAFDKFEKTGDIGEAIGTGIKELLERVVGAPLDLLKSAVSWILGKFGFDEAEKFLDSFSFTDLITTFVDRLVKWGEQTFEMVFQSIVDIWSDIADKFASGDILGGVAEILRGMAKFLLALPMDLVKNTIANIGEWFGADMSDVRKFSFKKILGGTNTDTSGDTAQSTSKSIVAEAGERTAAKKTAEMQKHLEEEKADAEKKAKDAASGKDKEGGIFGFFKDVEQAFFKALQENIEGGDTQSKIGSLPSTIGAEISALQSNNADMEAESESADSGKLGAMVSGPKTSNVSAQNVTYNSNNIPDRTSWMTTPLANWSL